MFVWLHVRKTGRGNCSKSCKKRSSSCTNRKKHTDRSQKPPNVPKGTVGIIVCKFKLKGAPASLRAQGRKWTHLTADPRIWGPTFHTKEQTGTPKVYAPELQDLRVHQKRSRTWSPWKFSIGFWRHLQHINQRMLEGWRPLLTRNAVRTCRLLRIPSASGHSSKCCSNKTHHEGIIYRPPQSLKGVASVRFWETTCNVSCIDYLNSSCLGCSLATAERLYGNT